MSTIKLSSIAWHTYINEVQRIMIKMIQKMFCWIHGIEDVQQVKKSGYELNNLYKILYKEFTVFTLDTLLKRPNIKIGSYDYRIEIQNTHKERDAIKILMTNFGGKVYREWESIGEMWITIDSDIVEHEKSKSLECPIHKYTLPRLEKVLNSLDGCENRSYSMLLDKYDSVFLTLIETIKEMKETNTIDQEAKQKIADVVQTFIDEFNSLEALYNKQIELDQQAIKDSLKRRLDDELDLVNKIKTSWNAEFQKEEVKIEV